MPLLGKSGVLCHFRVTFKHFGGTNMLDLSLNLTITLLSSYIIYEKWFKVVYRRITCVQVAKSGYFGGKIVLFLQFHGEF